MIYFKEISAIWVSYNKNLSQQTFRSLEKYILVKKFLVDSRNQVENLDTKFVILGFSRLEKKFLNCWVCKNITSSPSNS